MRRAVELGADVVGGDPALRADPRGRRRVGRFAFALAEEYGLRVDIHCDETDDDHARFVEVMAAETIRRGMSGRVTASHTTAMHSYNNAYAYRLITNIARAGLHMVTNPLDNSVLQGRFDTGPIRRGHTRVKELLAAGVNVCDRARLGDGPVVPARLRRPAAGRVRARPLRAHERRRPSCRTLLEMITANPAAALGVDRDGLARGRPGRPRRLRRPHARGRPAPVTPALPGAAGRRRRGAHRAGPHDGHGARRDPRGDVPAPVTPSPAVIKENSYACAVSEAYKFSLITGGEGRRLQRVASTRAAVRARHACRPSSASCRAAAAACSRGRDRAAQPQLQPGQQRVHGTAAVEEAACDGEQSRARREQVEHGLGVGDAGAGRELGPAGRLGHPRPVLRDRSVPPDGEAAGAGLVARVEHGQGCRRAQRGEHRLLDRGEQLLCQLARATPGVQHAPPAGERRTRACRAGWSSPARRSPSGSVPPPGPTGPAAWPAPIPTTRAAPTAPASAPRPRAGGRRSTPGRARSAAPGRPGRSPAAAAARAR